MVSHLQTLHLLSMLQIYGERKISWNQGVFPFHQCCIGYHRLSPQSCKVWNKYIIWVSDVLNFNGSICQEFVTHHVFEPSVRRMAKSSLHFACQYSSLNLFLCVTLIIHPGGMKHNNYLHVLDHINVGHSIIFPRSSIGLDLFP